MKILVVCVFAYLCCVPADGNEEDRRCFTPDAQLGTCIELSQCLVLAKSSQKNSDNLKIYRCEGPDKNKTNVCCGPPRVSDVKRTNNCPQSAAPADPRTACCGHDAELASRILGGNITGIEQYPWLAIIEYDALENNASLYEGCAGSLISSKYVLTAAHCVDDTVRVKHDPKRIRLGEYNTSSEGPDCLNNVCTNGTTVILIEEIIIHPNYKPVIWKLDDIALIRLADNAPFTDYIRPICLPRSNVVEEVDRQKLHLVVAGWGRTETETGQTAVKRDLRIPYVPREECNQQPYYKKRKTVRKDLQQGQICAGGIFKQDSCRGDSGGPLMSYSNGIYTLIGIVSFGPNICGLVNTASIYTYVYEYLPWIRTQMKP